VIVGEDDRDLVGVSHAPRAFQTRGGRARAAHEDPPSGVSVMPLDLDVGDGPRVRERGRGST
jgi:hypothetical protein